jgi:hypothetical protein
MPWKNPSETNCLLNRNSERIPRSLLRMLRGSSKDFDPGWEKYVPTELSTEAPK